MSILPVVVKLPGVPDWLSVRLALVITIDPLLKCAAETLLIVRLAPTLRMPRLSSSGPKNLPPLPLPVNTLIWAPAALSSVPLVRLSVADWEFITLEIGRASWRERLEVTLGGAPLKLP